MKKIIIMALCLCLTAGLASCSQKDSGSSDTESKEESSAAAAAEGGSSGLEEKIAEQQKIIDEQNKKLDRIEKVFNEIAGTTDENGIFSDDFDIDELVNGYTGEVHPIYDDTAVVAAYKSGDSSAITDEKDKFILETATKAIADIIKDGMTDYEKEKAVYDYVFSQSHYDEGNLSAIPHTEQYSHTPYGVLHDHTAICVGNATTFKLFMDMLDIDCMIIHSTEEGEHAWNLVKIDDDWYHVDITFDNGSDTPAYAMFNVPDEVKDRGGYPWDHDEFPAAEGTKYNFAVQNATEIDDIYKTAELFSKAIEDKENYCYFKFKLTKDEAKNEYIGYFYDNIITRISYQVSDGTFDGNSVEGTVIDGYYYGGMSFYYYDGSEDGDEGDIDVDFSDITIDYGKLYDAYMDAFGISLDMSDEYY